MTAPLLSLLQHMAAHSLRFFRSSVLLSLLVWGLSLLGACADQQVQADYITSDGNHVRFQGECNSLTGSCTNAQQTITKPDGSVVTKTGDMPDPTSNRAIISSHAVVVPTTNCQALYDAWGRLIGDTCGNVYRGPQPPNLLNQAIPPGFCAQGISGTTYCNGLSSPNLH